MTGCADPRLRLIAAHCALAAVALVLSACTDDRHGAQADAAADAAPRQCPTRSGYAGDELCLEPPDPAEGVQFHYGPSDPDDPDVVERFVLQPGESITDCFYAKSPFIEATLVGEVHIRVRPSPGTTLLVDVGFPDHADGLGPCASGNVSFWAGSRSESFDMPPDGPPVPEHANLAAKFPGSTQVALQLHMESEATDPARLREAWVNLLYPARPQDVSGIVGEFGGLAAIAGSIPPRGSGVWRGIATAKEDVSFPFLVGHFHTHTTRFTAWKVVGASLDGGASSPADGGSASDAGPLPPGWGTGTRTLVLEAYDFADPGVRWFDSVHQNPTPDPASKRGGGMSGPLELKAGDQLAWECAITNDLDTPLLFSDSLRTGEMCDLFGLYTPSDGSTWAALNL